VVTKVLTFDLEVVFESKDVSFSLRLGTGLLFSQGSSALIVEALVFRIELLGESVLRLIVLPVEGS
jgi:hypothetical protein